MNVKKLLELLQGVPEHMEVVIKNNETEFDLAPAEFACIKSVTFCEDPDYPNKQPSCKEKCFVISAD